MRGVKIQECLNIILVGLDVLPPHSRYAGVDSPFLVVRKNILHMFRDIHIFIMALHVLGLTWH